MDIQEEQASSCGVVTSRGETHYDNNPMQYIAIFHSCKNDNFQMKNCDFFSYFLLLNMDCGYLLEPPH